MIYTLKRSKEQMARDGICIDLKRCQSGKGFYKSAGWQLRREDMTRVPLFVLANHIRDRKTQSPVARGIDFELSRQLSSA